LEKGGWRGIEIRKMTQRGDEERRRTLTGRSARLGSQPYVLFFSGSFMGGSLVCIVFVSLDIPAFLAFYIYRWSAYFLLVRYNVGGCRVWRVVEA
jgi:hypothetical protein